MDAADEAIAAALAAAQQRISDQVRADTEGALRALVDAFGRGRWGSFWCRYRDPTTALRRLAELVTAAAPQLVEQPAGDRLVGRVVEVVADMALVLVAGERAGRDREAHELRDLLRAKDDFLRLTIHELRGPLGRARGYVSMIQGGDLGEVPAATKAAVEHLAGACEEMGGLLDSLTITARLEDGAEILNVGPCRLGALVAGAVEATADEAARKGARVDQELQDADLQLVGDAERLRIALANLIANAIKYGPAGSLVTVRGWRRSMGVAIAVSDQGPGLDPAEAAGVFEAHRRGRQSEAAAGLGLGLYIARRVVELHGGLIAVDSPPGQGATFTIFLPTTRT